VITWVLYNWVGIREQGAGKYFKDAAIPPGVPIGALILVTPIELLQVFIIRPFTLAVRLFANMFAGHMLLVVFSLGATYLITAGGIYPLFGVASFAMAIVMTFFEILVIVLQAYVFTVLTATYLAGSVEPAH
jgi:F-type H+-transporting ATPase subunit a